MKVIHIATTDFGGAAKGMLGLHQALLNIGVDSKILVAEKHSNNNYVVEMAPNIGVIKYSKHKVFRKIQKLLRKKGFFLTNKEKWDIIIRKVDAIHRASCYTSVYSNYDILDHELVKSADIIHLHWVGGFVDYPSFFGHVSKPVLWTIRDENPGLGGFHYRAERDQLLSFYREVENHFCNIKRQYIKDIGYLYLNNLSNQMMDFCSSVDFLSPHPMYKIYNSLDPQSYKLIDRSIAKAALGLSEKDIVVSFVSVVLSDYRKNLSKLVSAIGNQDIKLVCVGKNDFFKESSDNILCLGMIESEELMSIVYSASDVFVSPSLQESFGKTIVESLLCGTPVVTTNVGIAPEIISKDNGMIVSDTSVETIAKAIKTVLSRYYDRDLVRRYMVELFSPGVIANQYLDVYQEMLSKL